MQALFSNLLTASFHGSIVILAVMLLRVLLKKAPRKFICFLWLLAGLRLLMPFALQSSLSLQPMPEVAQMQQWQEAILPQSTVGAPTEPLPSSPAPAAKPAFNWRAALPYVWLGVAACCGPLPRGPLLCLEKHRECA